MKLEMKLSIDQIEAMRLYRDSASRSLSDTLREATAAKNIHSVNEGYLCDVTAGFSTRKTIGEMVTTASAYVFYGAEAEHFRSSHLSHLFVNDANNAVVVLNAAISEAVKATKVNAKFKALNSASKSLKPNVAQYIQPPKVDSR